MNAIDQYEQVAKVIVDVTPEGHPVSMGVKVRKQVTRFVIVDTHPDMKQLAKYRGKAPLNHRDAWVGDKNLARWFLTKKKAMDGLWTLWGNRMQDAMVSLGGVSLAVVSPPGRTLTPPETTPR